MIIDKNALMPQAGSVHRAYRTLRHSANTHCGSHPLSLSEDHLMYMTCLKACLLECQPQEAAFWESAAS